MTVQSLFVKEQCESFITNVVTKAPYCNSHTVNHKYKYSKISEKTFEALFISKVSLKI